MSMSRSFIFLNVSLSCMYQLIHLVDLPGLALSSRRFDKAVLVRGKNAHAQYWSFYWSCAAWGPVAILFCRHEAMIYNRGEGAHAS